MVNWSSVLGILDSQVANATADHEILPGGVQINDPDCVISEGTTPGPGQETEDTFFRNLAEDFCIRIPGAPGTGDPRRDELVQLLANYIGVVILVAVDEDMPWEPQLRRVFGVPGRRAGGSATMLRERIVEDLDLRNMAELIAYVAQLPAGESDAWRVVDAVFDLLGFEQGLVEDSRRLGLGAVPAAGIVTSAQSLRAMSIARSAPKDSLGSDWFYGKLVHNYIQADYQKSTRGYSIMERAVFKGRQRIPGTVGSLGQQLESVLPELQVLDVSMSTGRGRLRPDIVDFDRQVVYEIKSRAEAVYALWQVNGYCALYEAYRQVFNAARFLGRLRGPLIPGPFIPKIGYRPPSVVPLTGDKVAKIFTDPLLPGLILYDIHKTPRARGGRALASETVASSVIVALLLFGASLITPVPGDELVAGANLVRALRLIPALAL